MFIHSTSTLRGCLHRSSPIYGLRRCRREAGSLHLPKSASHRGSPEWNHPDPSLDEEEVNGASAAHRHLPPSQNTANLSIAAKKPQGLKGSSAASLPEESEIESRVQIKRPPRARTQVWRSDRIRPDVAWLSNRIFGPETTVSKRFEARKRPGPEPIYDLQPAGPGLTKSPKWSFPPAWKSVASVSDGLDRTMNADFRTFWKESYKNLYEQTRKEGVAKARESFDVHRQVAIAFVGDRDLKGLRSTWTAAPARNKQHLASIMIGSLVDSARMTLLMLSLDIIFPQDWKYRCDCLCYLDMVYSKEINGDPELHQLFAQQIESVSRIWKWPVFKKGAMPWHFLVLLLRHNTLEHCENITDTLVENPEFTDSRLILIMVDYFTAIGNSDRAIELLSRIPPEQREEHKVRILERCANLISIDTIEKSDSVGNFRALPTLIGLGLPVDARIHNRVLGRAMELQMPEVAWEVYQFMETRDIPVDAHGYLLLLQDSFERNDRARLDAMMSAIYGRKDLYQYPYLVAYMMNIVRVVCMIDRNLSSEKSVSHLLAVYDRAYDRSPLVKLGIADALPNENMPQTGLEQPPPAVLGFTIWAYVLCQRDERLVSALRFSIIHMLKQQDDSILACAEYDIMWNGFIHFYARSRIHLTQAIDVVESMIEQNLCMPTERTWSEVLCGFMKHGEEEVAIKVWRKMLARGVVPTKEGWQFLQEKYDQTVFAEHVNDVVDERRIPEGLEVALGWQSRPKAEGNTKQVVQDVPPSNGGYAEEFEDKEFGEEDSHDTAAGPEPASAKMYQ